MDVLVGMLLCFLWVAPGTPLAAQPGDASTHDCPHDVRTISTVLQLTGGDSGLDVVAKQETSVTMTSKSEAPKPATVNTTCTSNSDNAVDPNMEGVLEALTSLRESVDKLANALTGRQYLPSVVKTKYEAYDYPVIQEDNARWRLFWWYKAQTTWPALEIDVLQDQYGDCDVGASYCFSRLPEVLQETVAEMLAKDSDGNVYRWDFNPSNNIAHAVWEAFHDHVGPVKILNGNPWNPKVINGSEPKATQDSFMYRTEHGVKSLLIDDDNCDCYSSLSLGHGMCGTTFSTDYGPENVFGVDTLYDAYCQTTSPENGVFLYFRDDDDCINVECPGNTVCSDGLHSYSCQMRV